MRDQTLAWAARHGLSAFAAPGYESPTVSCISNDRGLDIGALNAFLRERGMIISNGYGALKGQTFRIAHMGDLQPADMEQLLAALDDYLATQG
jgi:aspartate aminotransferase-like enzyme